MIRHAGVVAAVTEFQRGLRIAGEIVGEADSRGDVIPIEKIRNTRERTCGDKAAGCRHTGINGFLQ